MATTQDWTVYRHYAGNKYHGTLANFFAADSDAAIEKLKELIVEQSGKWRAFQPGEVLVLKASDAETMHLVRVTTNVKVDRVQAT